MRRSQTRYWPTSAPSGWQHINFTGDYLWGADGSLGPDGFRPLRNLAALILNARAA